jgi:hypothetical protein
LFRRNSAHQLKGTTIVSAVMGKEKVSFVWIHFDKDRRCRKCPYIDKSKSATTTAMANHLKKAHGIHSDSGSAGLQRTSSSISGCSDTGSEKKQVMHVIAIC